MAETNAKCKYCGSLLDKEGYCTKPCKMGDLLKKLKRPQSKNVK